MRNQRKVTSVTSSLFFRPVSEPGVDGSSEIWIERAGSSPQGCGFAHEPLRAIGEEGTGWTSALHDSSIDRWFYLALLAVLTLWCSLLASGCGSVVAGTTASSHDSGSGSSSSVVISTSSVTFGSVVVGQTASASVSVTNQGASAVQIAAPQITGQYFSLVGQSAGSVSVNGGSSQTFNLQFAPTAAGAQTGTMTLTAGTQTLTVALSGTGTAGLGMLNGLNCTSSAMTKAGTDSCTVTLTAAAGTGLTVSLASSVTAVTVPGTVTIPAGATSATFTATVSAVTSAEPAELTATAGGETKTYTIQLDPAAPGLTLQSTNVSFGDVSLNSPATQTVLLTSSGTEPLTISAVTVTGAGFSATAGNAPVTLQPGQTVNLDLQFDPAVSGPASGSVKLMTNASPSTATVTLSGTGDATSYEVDLNWDPPTDSTDPVVGYDIYRAVGGSSSYQLLNSDVDDLAAYKDTTVLSGTSYTYYVVSVDGAGNQSSPSNLFSATVP